MSDSTEKHLGRLRALLGESPEASAAVDIIRGLITAGRPTGEPAAYVEASEVWCLKRINLAIEQAIAKAKSESYEAGYDDCETNSREDGEGLVGYDDDGDATSALASVYGDNNE